MGIGAKTKLLFFFSVSSAGGTEAGAIDLSSFTG
jgi:hypothetical protein